MIHLNTNLYHTLIEPQSSLNPVIIEPLSTPVAIPLLSNNPGYEITNMIFTMEKSTPQSNEHQVPPYDRVCQVGNSAP